MIRRLNSRFHQDFESWDTGETPANRICIAILLKMLSAPSGSGYGFNVAAAAIQPQGTLSDRDYLDYLMSLTGEDVEELEKRYRVNLRRSDLELSSPVQQNIDTLQRFFTDSHQSIVDPFVIKPDRKAETAERADQPVPHRGRRPVLPGIRGVAGTRGAVLSREPLRPARHLFVEPGSRCSREGCCALGWPLGGDDQDKDQDGFTFRAAARNHVKLKWQWVRNHIELYDLIVAAHNDARSLNYVAAEQKYAQALAWAGACGSSSG